MKSLEEIYKEMENNSGLRAGFDKAIKNNELGDFLVKLGCENVNEIVLDYYRERRKRGSEVSLDELDDVSGGRSMATLGKMLQNARQ